MLAPAPVCFTRFSVLSLFAADVLRLEWKMQVRSCNSKFCNLVYPALHLWQIWIPLWYVDTCLMRALLLPKFDKHWLHLNSMHTCVYACVALKVECFASEYIVFVFDSLYTTFNASILSNELLKALNWCSFARLIYLLDWAQ